MDKYKLEMSVKFKRDVKLCKKRGLPLDELWEVIRTLLRGEKLAPKYKARRLLIICTNTASPFCELIIRKPFRQTRREGFLFFLFIIAIWVQVIRVRSAMNS